MANQTELLNVSDEMKLDDERQSFEGLECGEGLCSSSSDTTEELYSSSTTDTRGDGSTAFPQRSGQSYPRKSGVWRGKDKVPLDKIVERAEKYKP